MEIDLTTEVVPELRKELKEYLNRQGYKVTEDAVLLGKSGIKHTFDMLAEKNDGFSTHSVCIGIAAGGDNEAEAGAIFGLANKAFDTGINNRLLITVSAFSEKSKQLAIKQRIKVIDGESIGSLLVARPKETLKVDLPFRFETAAQLVESLTSRGYKVEEKAKVRGKSGVDYTFDVLAHPEGEQVGQALAVDFMKSNSDVELSHVALFDTKAYDCGIVDKVIVVSPKLSPEAKQFAEHQRIRVLEYGLAPAAKPPPPLALAPPRKPAEGRQSSTGRDSDRNCSPRPSSSFRKSWLDVTTPFPWP